MTLSYVIPYYKNPGMLAEQFRVWAGYPDDLKAQIEVVLVDDGSPADVAALTVPRPDGLPAFRLYRVLEDRPWHQHGARNLGAKEALGPWLLLTDMDHVVPAASLAALLPRLTTDHVYTFHRVDAPNNLPTRNTRGELKPHVNTFAMLKTRFWRVGGYDEDCIGYGTDSYFRRRLYEQSKAVHLADVPIVRYPREVIPDASTTAPGIDPAVLRQQGRRRYDTRVRLDAKAHKGYPPKVLDFPWERVS